jgi:hypothetical protein
MKCFLSYFKLHHIGWLHISGNYKKGAAPFLKTQYGKASEVIFNAVKAIEGNPEFVEWLTSMYKFLAYGNEESGDEGDGEGNDMDTEFKDEAQ